MKNVTQVSVIQSTASNLTSGSQLMDEIDEIDEISTNNVTVLPFIMTSANDKDASVLPNALIAAISDSAAVNNNKAEGNFRWEVITFLIERESGTWLSSFLCSTLHNACQISKFPIVLLQQLRAATA